MSKLGRWAWVPSMLDMPTESRWSLDVFVDAGPPIFSTYGMTLTAAAQQLFYLSKKMSGMLGAIVRVQMISESASPFTSGERRIMYMGSAKGFSHWAETSLKTMLARIYQREVTMARVRSIAHDCIAYGKSPATYTIKPKWGEILIHKHQNSQTYEIRVMVEPITLTHTVAGAQPLSPNGIMPPITPTSQIKNVVRIPHFSHWVPFQIVGGGGHLFGSADYFYDLYQLECLGWLVENGI